MGSFSHPHLSARAFLLHGLLLSGLAGSLSAESGCGTVLDEEGARIALQRTEAGVYSYSPGREVADFVVPLSLHVVCEDDGSGGLAQARIDQALEHLSIAFDGTGICFAVIQQDEIHDSRLYALDDHDERDDLLLLENHPTAVDIYFVDHSMGFCGYSAFSWTEEERQGITMDNDCTGMESNPATFPHEVGHYLDLLHTHETASGVECPDGSNCGSAGDLICDTPADPDLFGVMDSTCLYTDPELVLCSFGNLQEYDPDPGNFMSYSPPSCRNEFTPDQIERMLGCLAGPRWLVEGWNAPDYDTPTPPGWADALVPRGDTNGSRLWCPVTPSLPGNAVDGTWVNAILHQGVFQAYHPGGTNRVYLDNSVNVGFETSGGFWNQYGFYNDLGPITVRGGRHSLRMKLDPLDLACEGDETNNEDGAQWVWTPYDLTANESLVRAAPPQHMLDVYDYPNCDGFQFSSSSSWSAVAVQPLDEAADYDLRLHLDPVTSTNGFDDFLVESRRGAGLADWILVNRNQAGQEGPYQAGVVNFNNATASMRINKLASRTLDMDDGVRICGQIPPEQILDIFEVFVGEDETQDWILRLESDSVADLDLYVYDAAASYIPRAGFLQAAATEGSSSETLVFAGETSFPGAGWYGIVVAKHGLQDLALPAVYDLSFEGSPYRMVIRPDEPVRFALVQDGDSFGNPVWREQLDAEGISYTVVASEALDTLDLDSLACVILPTATGPSAHENVIANLPRLDAFNEAGGLVIHGAAYPALAPAIGGVTTTPSPCDSVLVNNASPLLTGVASTSYGGPALQNTLDAAGSGWSILAWSACSIEAAVLFHEEKGLVVYGTPLEFSELFYPCSLGESIRNMVRWAHKRAKQTLRFRLSETGTLTEQVLLYGKDYFFLTLEFSNSLSTPWLSVSPLDGGVYIFQETLPVTFAVNATGLPIGVVRTEVEVTHNLYNSPETVRVVLSIAPEEPRIPAEITDLSIVPQNFSDNRAKVLASWTTPLVDVDGLPIVVDHFILLLDDNTSFDSPVQLTTESNPVSIKYHQYGMIERGFLRVIAVDEDGARVADSAPGLPDPRK